MNKKNRYAIIADSRSNIGSKQQAQIAAAEYALSHPEEKFYVVKVLEIIECEETQTLITTYPQEMAGD